jgi:glycosyltransferase involved in cell wall biosynthesis
MPTFILDARTATPHFPGIGRYVTNLAAALPAQLRADEQLTLLTPAAAQTPLTAPHPAVRTVPVTVSPFQPAQQWTLPRLLAAQRRRGAAGRAPTPQSALYHSSYYLMPYRPGLPTVLTIYDFIAMTVPALVAPRARLFFRVATRLALAASDHIIAISAATQRDLITLFHIPPQRITTIPLAPAAHFQPPTADALAQARAAYDLPPAYYLYVGINKPHKNLVRLVEAYTALPADAPPLLIGGAWDARYPEARHYVAAQGLDARVRFLGPIADAHLPALYAAATLFIYPSLYEGFGLPVIEAMACGAAVACSHAPGLEEAGGDVALRFDPTDTAALTQALRAGLHPATRADLQARGLAHARTFTWARVAADTLTVYRDLLARRA